MYYEEQSTPWQDGEVVFLTGLQDFNTISDYGGIMDESKVGKAAAVANDVIYLLTTGSL